MATVNVLNIYIVYKHIVYFLAHAVLCIRFYGNIKMTMFCLFHAIYFGIECRHGGGGVFAFSFIWNKFVTSSSIQPFFCYSTFLAVSIFPFALSLLLMYDNCAVPKARAGKRCHCWFTLCCTMLTVVYK